MNPKLIIRSEISADVEAITVLTVAAFKTLEISRHTEQFIILALRAAKALTISLVAEIAASKQEEALTEQRPEQTAGHLLGQAAEQVSGHFEGRLVGHIAFSPVNISDGTTDWYALGPLSVLPEYQSQGIGKSLIKEGLARLKYIKAQGCCLVGHPDYYRKLGFINTPILGCEGVPPEVFFVMPFNYHSCQGRIPQGNVIFHEAFKADAK